MHSSPETASSCQSVFHARWGGLRDPHVRALAWLIDSPDLLNPGALQWRGRIASMPRAGSDATRSWLLALDLEPASLHARLHLTPFTRLGRYAETLVGFYLEHLGLLAAQGMPVRDGKSRTIGEFDFLLNMPAGLVHWEFASKLYLLETSGQGQHVDYFVGPNLADTLGAKIGKVLDRQLKLAEHPSATACLPQPVVSAQALIKGWLFYRDDNCRQAEELGVSPEHCRGFWCPYGELDKVQAEAFFILPRLQWLAPASIARSQAMTAGQLKVVLKEKFEHDSMPVLIACLQRSGEALLEQQRGFIVPDDWQVRAGLRARRTDAQDS